MGKGFEFNADAVRGFAAVFAEAQSQVSMIQSDLAQSTAKAADFGKTWAGKQGAEYEQYWQTMMGDLKNLATHLGEISASLNQGTDLTVESDTSGYSNLKKIEDRMGTDPGTGGGGSVAV
ncbi:WXG100 family type VII secretion target [Actinokineospora soli]|uniref:WXG100 family type VII secretion target n=1 Tax=Actinokineospora soli TaxID=1048753 RepID=A0ABW2TYU9_9PSEU